MICPRHHFFAHAAPLSGVCRDRLSRFFRLEKDLNQQVGIDVLVRRVIFLPTRRLFQPFVEMDCRVFPAQDNPRCLPCRIVTAKFESRCLLLTTPRRPWTNAADGSPVSAERTEGGAEVSPMPEEKRQIITSLRLLKTNTDAQSIELLQLRRQAPMLDLSNCYGSSQRPMLDLSNRCGSSQIPMIVVYRAPFGVGSCPRLGPTQTMVRPFVQRGGRTFCRGGAGGAALSGGCQRRRSTRCGANLRQRWKEKALR